MGKFEKLVVLTVLFAAAVVLAISFSREGKVAASSPLAGAEQVLEDAPDLPFAETPGSLDGGQSGGEEPAPSPMLHAGAESEYAPAGLRPALQVSDDLPVEPGAGADRRILVDTLGLRPSFLDDYMTYTLVEGDTWSGLAQRFYQDGRFTRNLHLANEDLQELQPGKEILVPVFDFLAAEETKEGTTPAASAQPAPLASEAEARVVAKGASSAAGQPRTAKALEYEVRPGDTLSDISLAVFGTATRWQEILDTNRDTLSKPEALQVGMKLKIPEGGKLPAAGARKPEPKNVETKAASTKTAQAGAKPSAPSKKKKVL